MSFFLLKLNTKKYVDCCLAHRRQVVVHEVQRLRVERTLHPQGQYAQYLPLEKGSLQISDISFPLKKEYVRALAAGE